MQRFQDEQAARWCERLGLRVGGGLPSTRVSPANGDALRFRIAATDKAIDLVGLAYVVLMSSAREDSAAFAGGLLWLSRWELWSEDVDRVGYLLLGSLTDQREQAPEGDIAPGYLFEEGEFIDAHAAVSVPLLFQWDAYFVPAGGGFVAFISHEGYLEVLSPDLSSQERLLTRFQQAGWEPGRSNATSG